MRDQIREWEKRNIENGSSSGHFCSMSTSSVHTDVMLWPTDVQKSVAQYKQISSYSSFFVPFHFSSEISDFAI